MPTSRATTILYFDVVTLLYQIKNHYSSLFIILDSSTPSVFDMQSHLPLSPSAEGNHIALLTEEGVGCTDERRKNLPFRKKRD